PCATGTRRLSSNDPNCFPGEVEVLTTKGWKKFDRVSLSDQLAQFDLATGEIDFQNPLAVIVKQHDEPLVRIKTETFIDVICTKDHRFHLLGRDGFWTTVEADHYNTDKE